MLKYLNILKKWILILGITFSFEASLFAQQETMQKPLPLTRAEIIALRLQQEEVRSQNVKNFITTMLQQDGEAIKAAHERKFQKLVATLEQVDAERQETKRQQNERIKEHYIVFFKKVTQNLPQKGRHQDYSSYNQQFRQSIQRR